MLQNSAGGPGAEPRGHRRGVLMPDGDCFAAGRSGSAGGPGADPRGHREGVLMPDGDCFAAGRSGSAGGPGADPRGHREGGTQRAAGAEQPVGEP